MGNFILHWWIQAAMGILLGFLTYTLKSFYKKLNALVVGTQSILYYRLCAEGDKILSRGSITKQEIKDMTYFYNSYKNLNGNGVAKKIYEECMELPIKEVESDGI